MADKYKNRSKGRSFEANMDDAGRKIGRMFNRQSISSIALTRGAVKKIDEEEKTADVLMDSGHEIKGISLDIMLNDNNSILVFPAVDSQVIVGFIENRPELPYLVSAANVDRMQITYSTNEQTEDDNYIDLTKDYVKITRGVTVFEINGGKVTWTADLTEINGGELGGLVIVGDLTARLNKIQGEIDEIQTSISAHTHTVATTGTAAAQTGATTATAYSRVSLTQVKDEDYVNEKITQ